MTYQSSPDLLSAIQDTYIDFTWQESVCAYFDLIGEPYLVLLHFSFLHRCSTAVHVHADF